MPRSLMPTALTALYVLVLSPIGAEAQGRPQTRDGSFIGFGLGWGSMECEGVSFVLGGGYDVRVGAKLSLTPYANYVYNSYFGLNGSIIQAGLGLTWHSLAFSF